ncbi:hypothetical protein FB567DRAFT_432091 [Paraphoma chrysanthemicola]|uniref:Zn(2)-C6 fungal-type domain-containing protein n=1 Tax=Paraphoma chrysanthemicola TaxID=798071 RepID=A0A8K0RM08_9PLEO|nr:hypothetical protein FB567DRAFT_432091 [Paraphoma chrysanthemicola]
MQCIVETTIMTTGPNGQQKARKMRASCDACSRAKVKCDKVRPTCHRCGNMGICCNYSPSMRLGKPRKNRNPDGTIMRDVSPASSCGPMAPKPNMIPRTSTNNAESSPEPSDPFLFGPATPEFHYQDAFMAASFDGSQSPASFSEAGSLVSGWSNEDQMMFGTPSDMFTPIPQIPTTAPQYTGHVRSTSLQSQPEMYAPMDTLSSPPLVNQPFFSMPDPIFNQDKMALSPPMLAAPLPTPPTSATLPNHDCTQFAFQTLNSLYAPPSSQPMASDFNGAQDGLPTLDAVLSTNKSAVDKLYVLLGCSCSGNPHFSTTIAFTIMKILSWYQAIAGVTDQDDGLVNTPMEAFTHTPISLGDFRLEVEDEDTFRTQLVLGELRKVEKLIDKFSERYCKTANPAETGIEGGVYNALEQLLRTRVRDTFKVTMRTAPEDVKRQVASRSQNRVRFNTL